MVRKLTNILTVFLRAGLIDMNIVQTIILYWGRILILSAITTLLSVQAVMLGEHMIQVQHRSGIQVAFMEMTGDIGIMIMNAKMVQQIAL